MSKAKTTRKVGRPRTATEKVIYQVRLEQDEASALEALITKRAAAAMALGSTTSAAAILRALLRDGLVKAGVLKPVKASVERGARS